MGKPTGRLPPGPDVPPAGHLGRLQPGAHPRGRVDRTVRGVRDALARLEADGAICRGRRGRATRVGNVCASYLLPRLALVLFKVARAARKVVTPLASASAPASGTRLKDQKPDDLAIIQQPDRNRPGAPASSDRWPTYSTTYGNACTSTTTTKNDQGEAISPA